MLVRGLVDDDPMQSPQARRILESLTPHQPGWISTVALVETYWVLRRAYGVPRSEVMATLSGLLRQRAVVVE